MRKPTTQNFRNILTNMSSLGIPFSRYLINSLVITFLVIVLSIFISLSAGYVLSKKKFKAKKLLFGINTLSLMFVPAAVGIPRYLIISKAQLHRHLLPFRCCLLLACRCACSCSSSLSDRSPTPSLSPPHGRRGQT